MYLGLGLTLTAAPVLGQVAEGAPVPVNLTPPAISGNAVVGETLVVIPGVWTNDPVLTYQWRRDGEPIEGATGFSYDLVEDDEGALIDCLETATNDHGTAEEPSNALGPVEAAPPEPVVFWSDDFGVEPIANTGTAGPGGTPTAEIEGRVAKVVPGEAGWAWDRISTTNRFYTEAADDGSDPPKPTSLRGTFATSTSTAFYPLEVNVAHTMTAQLWPETASSGQGFAELIVGSTVSGTTLVSGYLVRFGNTGTVEVRRRLSGTTNTTPIHEFDTYDPVVGTPAWVSAGVELVEGSPRIRFWKSGELRGEFIDEDASKITTWNGATIGVTQHARIAKVRCAEANYTGVEPDPAPEGIPFLGAYLNYVPTTRLVEFEEIVGKEVMNVPAHGNRADWTAWTNSMTDYAVSNKWLSVERPMTFSIPMFVVGETLADAAAGEFEDHWEYAAGRLLAGYGDTYETIYVRVGEEHNAPGWMPWSAYGHEDDFKTAFQRFVNVFRAAAIAAGKEGIFKFEWNCAAGTSGQSGWADPDLTYPGDEYVDVIGLDFYWDAEWDGMDAASAWNLALVRPQGLLWHKNFAAAHNKPVAFSEWGLTLQIQPNPGNYFHKVADHFRLMQPLYANYWAVDSAGFDGELDKYPTAAAQFRDAFNPEA